MVEKEDDSYDGASTVIVDATETSLKDTVGAAIDILEDKLVSKGIVLQVPASTGERGFRKVDGKLLRLPTLIELAITCAIDAIDIATDHSVGETIDSFEKTLVAGNVVALFSDARPGYIRMENTQISYVHGTYGKVGLKQQLERFLVVDAGDGCIAFYSPSNRRFLGMTVGGQKLSASGYPVVNASESPRANEIFQVMIDTTNRYRFRLRCPIEDKECPYAFQVVKICGFD